LPLHSPFLSRAQLIVHEKVLLQCRLAAFDFPLLAEKFKECGQLSTVIRVSEIEVRSALTRSRIPSLDFCLNPYLGCGHGCLYCYADFMCRFRKRNDRWGSFVDAKVNVPELLEKELRRRPPGRVSISTVTDPYQPVERKYQLTRQCLQLLLDYGRRISILTKSDLVLRDLDLLRQFKNCRVGLTITTDDEKIKRLFEPASPTIRRRIKALEKLKEEGIVTYAFIGPLLPANPEKLGEMIAPFADSLLVDRMNYTSKVVKIYRQNRLERFLEDDYFEKSAEIFKKIFEGKQVDVVY